VLHRDEADGESWVFTTEAHPIHFVPTGEDWSDISDSKARQREQKRELDKAVVRINASKRVADGDIWEGGGTVGGGMPEGFESFEDDDNVAFVVDSHYKPTLTWNWNRRRLTNDGIKGSAPSLSCPNLANRKYWSVQAGQGLGYQKDGLEEIDRWMRDRPSGNFCPINEKAPLRSPNSQTKDSILMNKMSMEGLGNFEVGRSKE